MTPAYSLAIDLYTDATIQANKSAEWATIADALRPTEQDKNG